MTLFRKQQKIRKQNNGYTRVGIMLSGVILLLIVVGIFYTPYDPDQMNGSLKLTAPSLAHWFGTDQFGRDVFSRVLTAAKNTLVISLGTILIGGGIGILLGAFAGYKGGLFDEILMRITDVLASFPSVLLALVFVSISGPGKYRILFALGIVFIPSFARVVRSEILKIREADYVKSAVLSGVRPGRILVVHMLPNMLPTLLSTLAIGFNNAALAEAGMSYLGIGIQPPDASLGKMLSEAQSYLASGPWCAIFPGVFLILLVFGVGLLGEGIAAGDGGKR